ncbi:aldo/keto reductase [Spirochaeta isovalerica]|uniref:Aryl-alcohol dehydrogenase-like predicted oxidoreductase n=1 Tax=Spirochaeta isovalerica TaxID=150 RepID=A0A841RCG6_9SPIO|nr:aldo/keto reductase [Spirochaeta isovalerica]MBB6480680.1 aryl-alcohol dehydrogenase-like predicted oxidoreductase [Spirochaeta isovalerica]
MDYKYLGNTGVQVSELCFGTMSFGGDADKSTSLAMYKKARDRGINFFDCANVYQKGLAEEYLGEFSSAERQELILTTKAYFPFGDGINSKGASRKHLFESLHASLKRLKTDYVDLFYIHRFDDNMDLADIMRTLDDMVSQGKILYPAVSNFAAWQVVKANSIASERGYAPIRCIQPMYNLAKRQAEVEILPMAQSENIAVTSYSPLGGGLLTGKYGKNRKPETGRIVANKMYGRRYGDQINFNIAEAFTEFAEKNNMNPVSLAVRWVAAHSAVTAPIIGARNPGQLEDSLASVDINMTEEMRNEISSFSPEPPPATDRNEESTSFNYSAVLKK